MVLEFSWHPGWSVGRGFDVARADVVGGDGLDTDDSALVRRSASEVQASTHVIHDQASSAKATHGALSVTGKGLGFQASLGATFSLNTTATQNSVLIQRASSTRVDQLIVRSSQPLGAQARAELAKGPAAFRAAYGTHFIAGYISGGAFLGRLRYQFTSQTDSEKFAVDGAVEVKRAVAQVDVKAKVDHTEASTRTHTEVDGDCRVIGGSASDWKDAAFISTPGQLAKAEVDFLSSTDDHPVRIIALVFPWSYLDEVPAEVSAIGPADPENDALIKEAADQLHRLEYAEELLVSAGEYPIKGLLRECRVRREELNTALKTYLTSSGAGLKAAKDALGALVAHTETLLARFEAAWTFEVEYVAQFHTANKSLKDSDSERGFQVNGTYPVLRWIQETVRVEPGVSKEIAMFQDHNKTVLKMWVRVDFDDGRLRVGTYFGYAGQEAWALAHENREEGSLSQWAFRRSGTDGVATEWTENAKSMRNDGYRDQCFIRARILPPAKPTPVPTPRAAADSRTTTQA